MKHLFFTLLCAFSILSSCVPVAAQTVTNKGNNTFIVESKKETVSTPTQVGTVTIKGIAYPIYKGAKGGIYIIKEGKKVYSFPGKTEIQKQLK